MIQTLTEVTKAARRGASCDSFGCRLLLQVVENRLVVRHTSVNLNFMHRVMFDQTQLMWEVKALEEAVMRLKEDHIAALS